MAGFLFTLIGVLFVLAAPRPVPAQGSGEKLVIAGAPSLVGAAEKFSVRFRKQYPHIDLEIRAGGSNYAVEALREGKLDVGLVTRSLTAREQEELYCEPLGHDAIILVTYGANSVRNLTLEQIRGIYRGVITNWRELGGEDRGIIPLTREKSSALRTIFLERIFGRRFDGREKAFTIRASKEKILRTIKRVEGSLGYGIVALAEAEAQGVIALAVGGKSPTLFNVRTGAYPLTRPQLAVSRLAPDGASLQWILGFARFTSTEAKGER